MNRVCNVDGKKQKWIPSSRRLTGQVGRQRCGNQYFIRKYLNQLVSVILLKRLELELLSVVFPLLSRKRKLYIFGAENGLGMIICSVNIFVKWYNRRWWVMNNIYFSYCVTIVKCLMWLDCFMIMTRTLYSNILTLIIVLM